MIAEFETEVSCKDGAGAVLLAYTCSDGGVVVALDLAGQVVWQRDVPFGLMACRMSLQGTLFLVATDGRVLEMAFDGRILHQWVSAPVTGDVSFGAVVRTEWLHHSVQEIAPDIYLSLSKGRDAEKVLVFDRRGAVHWAWDLSDPERLGVGVLGATCAVLDPTDGGVVLALEQRNAVAKLTRRGVLDWVLAGPLDGVEPRADKRLLCDGAQGLRAPRDVSFAANGDVLICAKGGAGAYRIDAQAGKAQQTWAFGGADDFAPALVETPDRVRVMASVQGGAVWAVDPAGRLVFQARCLQRDWTCASVEYVAPQVVRRLR